MLSRMIALKESPRSLEINNDNLNINSGFDGDAGDLSDDIGGGVDVKDSLVNSHLPSVVGVRALSARRFADDQLQEFGGHADRATDFEALTECFVLELGTDLLEGVNLSRGEGDADAVDFDILRFHGLRKDGLRNDSSLMTTVVYR